MIADDGFKLSTRDFSTLRHAATAIGSKFTITARLQCELLCYNDEGMMAG
jgi:hypothetical protein